MGRAGRKAVRLAASADDLFDLAPLERAPVAGSGAGKAGEQPGGAHAEKAPSERRRRFGQFFTPMKVARAMAEWVMERNPATLLDPALGMGVFVRAALERSQAVRITAYEKDPQILRAYLRTHPPLSNVDVLLADFLLDETVSEFDAVLMNPPYLRHHDINYDFDIFARVARTAGVEISRLSNAYLLFTIKAVLSLAPGGRAAIIIPAEWMNANFGKAMKTFLLKRALLREIFYFSGCSEVFEDALTTASVLLIERGAMR